jgi:hypothetical protein
MTNCISCPPPRCIALRSTRRRRQTTTTHTCKQAVPHLPHVWPSSDLPMEPTNWVSVAFGVCQCHAHHTAPTHKRQSGSTQFVPPFPQSLTLILCCYDNARHCWRSSTASEPTITSAPFLPCPIQPSKPNNGGFESIETDQD